MHAGDGEQTEADPAPPSRSAPRSIPLRWRVAAGATAVLCVGLGLRLAPDPTTQTASPVVSPAATTTSTTTVGSKGDPVTVPIDPGWPHEPSPTVPDEVLDGLRFTDVTEQAGLDHPRLGRRIQSAEDMSGGVAVGDYDDDGDLDLFVTRIGLTSSLYRNDGDGTFVDVTDEAGVVGQDPEQGYSGATFADIDSDGTLDLLVTSVGGADTLLYRNDGDGTFAEEAERRGLTWPGERNDPDHPGNVFSASFADWNGDGHLDVALTDWYTERLGSLLTGQQPGVPADDPRLAGNDQCKHAALADEVGFTPAEDTRASRTRLMVNDGTGHFTDRTAELGISPDTSAAFSSVFADLDDDGWPDLLVAGDFCTSKLYRNVDGERFEDITAAAGLGTDENGMGLAVEDLDGDGLLDIVVTGIALPADAGTCPAAIGTIGCSGNRVYRNQGDGTFTDATDAFGVRDAFWAWGVAAEDLTNTGRRDLVVAAGWSQAGLSETDLALPAQIVHRRSALSPSRLWRNVGDQPWPEVSDQVGFVNRGNSKAIVAFDMDDDGDLDLIEINTETPPVLHRNDTPTGAGHRWLRVRLRDDTTGNRRGIGAQVVATSDSLEQTGNVRAGGSFQAGVPDEAHFGLGTDTTVTVAVRWPGSLDRERFEVAAVDQVVTLTRGEGTPT